MATHGLVVVASGGGSEGLGIKPAATIATKSTKNEKWGCRGQGVMVLGFQWLISP